MADQAPPLPPKGLGSIQLRDFFKGLYYAAIASIILFIGFLFNYLFTEHPHLPTWSECLPYVKGIAVNIGGYIIGKFGVNNVGQILRSNKPVVSVSTKTLEDLKEKADSNA